MEKKFFELVDEWSPNPDDFKVSRNWLNCVIDAEYACAYTTIPLKGKPSYTLELISSEESIERPDNAFISFECELKRDAFIHEFGFDIALSRFHADGFECYDQLEVETTKTEFISVEEVA